MKLHGDDTDHERDDGTEDYAREWLRTRPEPIKALLRRFPPGCIVEGNRPLVCPAPGKQGLVISYDEHDDGTVGLQVTHTPEHGGPDFGAEVDPDWIRVVEYGPLDAAAVAEILDRS